MKQRIKCYLLCLSCVCCMVLLTACGNSRKNADEKKDVQTEMTEQQPTEEISENAPTEEDSLIEEIGDGPSNDNSMNDELVNNASDREDGSLTEAGKELVDGVGEAGRDITDGVENAGDALTDENSANN